jgi:predicted RNA-binding protein with PIN domain
MALVRILVDGYSLLHNWPELADGAPRHSARAREELVQILTRYHDVTGEPVTVFFDGAGAPPNVPKNESSRDVEVLTDDFAERDMVSGFGGSVASCANFIRMIGDALAELQDELKNHNRAERTRFNQSR